MLAKVYQGLSDDKKVEESGLGYTLLTSQPDALILIVSTASASAIGSAQNKTLKLKSTFHITSKEKHRRQFNMFLDKGKKNSGHVLQECPSFFNQVLKSKSESSNIYNPNPKKNRMIRI